MRPNALRCPSEICDLGFCAKWARLEMLVPCPNRIPLASRQVRLLLFRGSWQKTRHSGNGGQHCIPHSHGSSQRGQFPESRLPQGDTERARGQLWVQRAFLQGSSPELRELNPVDQMGSIPPSALGGDTVSISKALSYTHTLGKTVWTKGSQSLWS